MNEGHRTQPRSRYIMAGDLLLRRMEDLASRAKATGFAASKFLTAGEAAEVERYFSRRKDVRLTLDGGFPNAERVTAVFSEDGYERGRAIAAFAVSASAAVGHRDILGALMALGLAREAVGDITPTAFCCIPQVAAAVAELLTSAGRASLKLTEISPDDLPDKTDDYTERTDTVASPRLDALAAAAFGLSRGRAVELIELGLVSLNHTVCRHPSREVAEGGIISVRGKGRARLARLGGASKKGRLFVTLHVY